MLADWEFFYDKIVLPTLHISFQALSLFDQKIRQGLVDRRSVFESLSNQLSTARDLEQTLWFHFTSVGEFEQCKPLIEYLHPDYRIVLTYFSPSVSHQANSYQFADAAIYLPLDSKQNAHRLIDLIQPSILVFSKFDIWPNLVWQAKKRDVKTVLIAGTLQPKSKRLHPLANKFFRSVHQQIDLHCVVSEADANRFRQICPSSSRIVITGDTRFDQVHARASSAVKTENFLPGQSTLSRPILVAGSTYAEEEKVLVTAIKQIKQTHQSIQPHLLIVPHEPNPKHVQNLTQHLRNRNLTFAKYTELDDSSDLSQVDVVVIDTVGILAQLYRLADITFVGGSFHGSVHNVMEPAVMAKPVIFGPTIDNAQEAQLLVQLGGAKMIQNSQQLHSVIIDWLSAPSICKEVGQKANHIIESNLGATQRTLSCLVPYLASVL